ncbi:uncharacterized protein LOC112092611 [Morus notabilis]|uniref:uncharacterized protein LOC112092611 n=1 Tax=Morus notabilis TaxID=981085 RepID=UPI000CECF3E5|nr:uncharacterized protein LOC112092611 [Morus notabilis]
MTLCHFGRNWIFAMKIEWDCPTDSVRHKKREKNDRVYVFLAGLNQELDEVRGRILGRKPLPSIREVFSEVRREETRRKVMLKTFEPKNSPEVESLALVSKGSDSDGEKKRKPWCDRCKKCGIPKRLAWKLHGKPPQSQKRRNKGENRALQTVNEDSQGQQITLEELEKLEDFISLKMDQVQKGQYKVHVMELSLLLVMKK